MIFFDKFGLSDEDRALLIQQQADAVHAAVLEERNNQLERRLTEAYTNAGCHIQAVFTALELAGKLTGATEDRAASVAAIIQGAIPIMNAVLGRVPPPAATYEDGPQRFRVGLMEIAYGYATAHGRPDMSSYLLQRLTARQEIYLSVGEVIEACREIWSNLQKDPQDPEQCATAPEEESEDDKIYALARKYAEAQGRPDLGDLLGYELVTHSVWNYEVLSNTDEVATTWARVLKMTAESGPQDVQGDAEGESQDVQGGVEVESDFDLNLFAREYAEKQGRTHLADAFALELAVSSTLGADQSCEDFCRQDQQVKRVWYKTVKDAGEFFWWGDEGPDFYEISRIYVVNHYSDLRPPVDFARAQAVLVGALAEEAARFHGEEPTLDTATEYFQRHPQGLNSAMDSAWEAVLAEVNTTAEATK